MKTWYELIFTEHREPNVLTKFCIEHFNQHIIRPQYPRDTHVLINFRTDENFRKMGYGKYLLTEIMKKRKFILASYSHAEDFYRKCGLKEVHINYKYTIFENL